MVLNAREYGKKYLLWVQFMKWCEEGKKVIYATPWGNILSPALQQEELALARKGSNESYYGPIAKG